MPYLEGSDKNSADTDDYLALVYSCARWRCAETVTLRRGISIPDKCRVITAAQLTGGSGCQVRRGKGPAYRLIRARTRKRYENVWNYSGWSGKGSTSWYRAPINNNDRSQYFTRVLLLLKTIDVFFFAAFDKNTHSIKSSKSVQNIIQMLHSRQFRLNWSDIQISAVRRLNILM